MLRTHDIGSLNASLEGEKVTLAGWVDRRRDHGGVVFIDLRDATGIAQVVVRDEDVAHQLRSEFVLQVTGEVSLRPEGNENPNIPTGEIEVLGDDVEILNTSAPLPFQVSDHAEDSAKVGEEVRLRYRYLDLRRSQLQHALRLRSKVSQAARSVLDNHDFVEVETPTLTRSTPKVRDSGSAFGARIVVRCRSHRGCSSAFDGGGMGMLQIAPATATRTSAPTASQFTRLDVEMSFIDQDDVIAVAEDVLYV